ncbi:hypothetical protein CH296_00330 [Rhodococcus sp. 14-2496-1d]|uniref:hypothetical protein n=1 Tax=Rhodococcus sp. 14-2496-1d TaxID=2023146 RepID=UPI000B9AE910|nr:hypothetical protein [Rhodococcus sp. 14-2496-1d]OZF40738.1 hypothetical protein CH296_00330 [Rhodococcus sp. 14-2496-1d]
MTLPSGGYPAGSINTGTGISAHAAKTQSQWKAEQTGQFATKYETNFFDKWINNLFGGFFNGILGLISALVFGLKGITGGLIDLTGALKATDTKADTAINTATGAAQAVVNVQKVVTQKLEVFDVRSSTPGYVAINGTEWPSIPRSDLKMLPADVNITRHRHPTPGSNGYTDYDTIGSVDVRMTRLPEKLLPANTQWFAFIRIPDDTALSGLNFFARGTPTALHTRVFSVSPTGDMTALTPESPNLGSLLVNSQHTSTPTNFADAIVEAGTWVAVRFRAVGTVYLAGTENFTPELPQGFYPRQISATTAISSTTAAPDSIPESSVTWPAYPSGFVVYVAVGNNIVVAQAKRYFSDNFDREDSGGLFGIGGKWSISGALGIRSNDVAFIDTNDGVATALWSSPLTTDKQVHTIHVGSIPTVETPAAWARMLFRCAQNRSTGLAVAYRQGTIRLETLSNGSFSAAITVPATVAQANEITVVDGETVDGVDYLDRVIVYHKGIEIIRTSIPSSTVPYGPQRRFAGVGVSRTPFQNSPRIADWLAYDTPDTELAA